MVETYLIETRVYMLCDGKWIITTARETSHTIPLDKLKEVIVKQASLLTCQINGEDEIDG